MRLPWWTTWPSESMMSSGRVSSVPARAARPGLGDRRGGRGGRHERAGDPGIGAVAKGHPEAHALPVHAALEGAVGAADDPVGLEEQAGADGVVEGGDERGPALEAGHRVLEGAGVVGGEGRAVAATPFIQVGAMSVIAVDIPSLGE